MYNKPCLCCLFLIILLFFLCLSYSDIKNKKTFGSYENKYENFCPGKCDGKRYPIKYLYSQTCGSRAPYVNNLTHPYYINQR